MTELALTVYQLIDIMIELKEHIDLDFEEL